MSVAVEPRNAKLTFERRIVVAEVASDEISPDVEAFLRQISVDALIVREALAAVEFPMSWPYIDILNRPRPSRGALLRVRDFPKVIW